MLLPAMTSYGSSLSRDRLNPQNVVNSRPVSMRRSLASRGANTYEAQQIADALIGDNIKKGWSEVHSQSEAHAETA